MNFADALTALDVPESKNFPVTVSEGNALNPEGTNRYTILLPNRDRRALDRVCAVALGFHLLMCVSRRLTPDRAPLTSTDAHQ